MPCIPSSTWYNYFISRGHGYHSYRVRKPRSHLARYTAFARLAMKKVEAAATSPDLAPAQLANIVWVWFQLTARCRIHVLWVWFWRQAALGDAVCHEKSIFAYRRRENGRRLRSVLLSFSNLQRPKGGSLHMRLYSHRTRRPFSSLLRGWFCRNE